MQRHCSFFLLLYCCSYVHKVCSILILILGESIGKDGLSQLKRITTSVGKLVVKKATEFYAYE